MSRRLLMVSVGPVADFILASRRTRDVHFSSWQVAAMGREAARALSRLGELVFPVDVSDPESPVSDRVLVLLNAGEDPAAATSAARNAVLDVWRREAGDVLTKHGAVGISQDLWNAQLSDPDLVEVFSAWTVFDGDVNDGPKYVDARRRVEKLINARETCTDFSQWTGPGSVPKNSLDGRRETVLSDSDRGRKARVPRGIRENEQLDMPGVVKRLGEGGTTHFVSVSRIAVDPYVRGSINNPGRKAVIEGVVQRISSSGLKDLPFKMSRDDTFRDFQYDGQLLMASRLDSMISREFVDSQDVLPVLSDIRTLVSKGQEPNPYLAVLACDGDRMGTYPGIESLETHRAFSRRLSSFSREASNIVRNNHGSLVYAGGDDVLAFLPLDKAARCAAELNTQFGQSVPGGTLSVGVAIVHVLTPMAGSMIRFAYEAEDLAKSSRNALGITIHKRSGSPVSWVCSWDDKPAVRLTEYATLYDEEVLPAKAAYSLRKLVEPYGDGATWITADLIRGEVSRLLDKKKVPEASRDQVVAKFLESVGTSDADAVRNVRRLSDALIVARMILGAENQAKGR